jgi:hypothetical protein
MEVQPVSVRCPGHDGRRGQRAQAGDNANKKRQKAALEGQSLAISFLYLDCSKSERGTGLTAWQLTQG